MPKFYCFKCGSGTDYMYNKPKMCLKCGMQFFETSASLPTKQANVPVKETSFNLIKKLEETNLPVISTDDEEEYKETPRINLNSFAEEIQAERNCKSLILRKPQVDSATKSKRGRPRKA